MKIILLILGILALRFVYYLYHYLRAKRFLSKYEEYIQNQDTDYILRHRQTIIRTLDAAGIKDSRVSHVEPMGFGHVATGTISLFENMPNLREDIVGVVLTKLSEAPGALLQRMIDTFNPFYW